MKKKLLLFFFFTSLFTAANAQEHAWIYLDSKENVANYLANPLTMLTQRALDRRTAQSIALDVTDVPVTPSYITDISNATGITYIGASKWLNAIHVTGSQANINALATTFTYVDHIEFANDALNFTGQDSDNDPVDFHSNKFPEETNSIIFDYGNATNQIEMFNCHKLHEDDFTGANRIIAVIDAGFPNVDTNPGFNRIRTNGQILGGWDFVNDSSNFYTGHSHGSNVLSFIAGYYNGATNYAGSAPDAGFYLFISEDVSSETPAEETYWVMAAEQADYFGVDILNTSLGYYTFDDPDYNYNYNTDLDGNTSFITRGAEIAFSKGMVVVNAAGNEGNNSSWDGRIAMPADGPNVLTVGAVNSLGNYASFSSRGPTSDSRLKPDVVVQGQGAAYINTGGGVTSGSGTSYSSPLMAGGVACLWDALPGKTNAEIVQIIKESASIYATPNFQLGYGIPDLDQAVLLSLDDVELPVGDFGVYPNPAGNQVTVIFPQQEDVLEYEIHDILGNRVLNGTVDVNNATLNVSHLSSGLYLANFRGGGVWQTIKLLKQ
ncbi:MAG: S8 family serine peptidase [Flavobacteriaceae bacterium]|nr:S8 family serine peptidase [Flavobacteriaceae bacterium]